MGLSECQSGPGRRGRRVGPGGVDALGGAELGDTVQVPESGRLEHARLHIVFGEAVVERRWR